MSTGPVEVHHPTPSGELQAFEQRGVPPESSFLAPLHALDRAVGRAEVALLIILVAAMTLLGTTQVIMRKVGMGLPWADPLLRHMVLVAGMIGAMVATQAGRHLNMDALARVIPEGPKRWIEVIVNVTAATTCAVLVWVAIPYLQNEQGAQSEPIVGALEPWHVELIFPLAFGVMAYRFLLFALDGLLGRPRPSQEPKIL